VSATLLKILLFDLAQHRAGLPRTQDKRHRDFVQQSHRYKHALVHVVQKDIHIYRKNLRTVHKGIVMQKVVLALQNLGLRFLRLETVAFRIDGTAYHQRFGFLDNQQIVP